ncbi:MAG: hypothetical protein IJO52_06690, partial [Clostridia bacterium]|nr:hypothetical protein [Clostridia bacterium]
MALFPILLVLCVEMGHFQSFSKTMTFVFSNIGVFIFDIFLVGFIFAALALLVRHVWISAAICTVAFYTFSCIEYYKFNVSGSHFLISDLAMTKNVTDVATFANLSFNIPLFVIAMLLQLYVVLLFFMNVKVTLTSPVRYAAAMGVLLVTVISLVTPYFNTVCEAAGVNYSYTKNTFQENERFSNNSLTANLAVSVNQLIHSKPKRPDDYNEAVVEAIVENELTTDTSDKRKVNVVTVMSESFADFRNFLTIYSDTESIPEGTYDVLDEIYQNSHVGTCVVPTFGGGTVKTEIELIFGLPVEAQGNSAIPLSVFSKGREYPSVVSMYAENGYHTAYFHPFSPEFYERVDYYGNFGFDSLMFDEDMSV